MTEQEAVETLFDLTGHPGWALLMEDAEAKKTSFADIMTCQSGDEMRVRQGRVMELDFLLTYREVLRSALDAEDL